MVERQPQANGGVQKCAPPLILCYSGFMGLDFFEFHQRGNKDCTACFIPTASCACGGLWHTQLGEELEYIEGRCDRCDSTMPPIYKGKEIE